MAHILIVDDEPHLRALLCAVLEQDGHRVSQAADGREALRRQKMDPAEVIAIDAIMPEMNGADTALALRNLTRDVHIIGMTGADHHAVSRRMAELIGSAMMLPKPFLPIDLVDKVDTLLASVAVRGGA